MRCWRGLLPQKHGIAPSDVCALSNTAARRVGIRDLRFLLCNFASGSKDAGESPRPPAFRTIRPKPIPSAPATNLPEAVEWLEGEAHRIIRASMSKMKDGTAAFPPQVGIGYDAFWLRD